MTEVSLAARASTSSSPSSLELLTTRMDDKNGGIEEEEGVSESNEVSSIFG